MDTATSDQTSKLTSKNESDSPQNAPPELNTWQQLKVEMSFVYSRSGGGLMQTGRALITEINATHLTLRATSTTLIINIVRASFSTEPQLFFNSTFTSSRNIAGVSISLENFDWLFLTPAVDGELLREYSLIRSAK
jgi:hypothetical protein